MGRPDQGQWRAGGLRTPKGPRAAARFPLEAQKAGGTPAVQGVVTYAN